jgi:hypothetical protein
MARRKKIWLPSSPTKPEPRIPEALKAVLTEKANVLIETKLKPWKLDLDKAFKEKGFNYVVDVYTTWWRSYFYFCSRYRCPGPNAINEYFEARFTRMKYVGDRLFNLAYMRHTGQWWEVYEGLTLEECLETIEREQIFWP